MKDTLQVGDTSKIMRYEKVVATLFKYGFEDILSHPPLGKFLPQSNILVPTRNGKKVSKFTRHERIRLVCEELGTTFIKFAQIASNRPDLLPEELIFELEKLQDDVPPVPIEDILDIINSELPRPIDELLEYFNPIPLACASMAQVHRARLLGGKEVVLKIQRPRIKSTIASDIAILKNISNVIEKYMPQYKAYQPLELVKMFEDSISEELSFRLEANNLAHFHNMFKNNSNVFVPELYRELCTDRIICMEYVDGFKITDLDNLNKFKITGEDLAKRGISLYFEQVFEYGFFHADPHPGNIFVLKDGRIAFIDYGMVGTIIESDKVLFARILLAMYDNDVLALKRSILKFTTGLTKDQEKAFEYDVVYFLREYSRISLDNIDAKEAMRGLNSLFYDYKIKIPSNLLLLIKALVILEGVGLKLNPEYDIIESIGPYVQKLLTKKYNPNRIQKELLNSMEETTSMIKDFPHDVREIIKKVKEGKLHIEIEHKGLEPFGESLSRSINRLSYAMILVAIILASALLVMAKVPPLYKGVPSFAIGGFLVSALFALRLIYKMK